MVASFEAFPAPPQHPALGPGGVAVITGAASGIGRATARRLAAHGLKVCLCDLPGPALEEALTESWSHAKSANEHVISMGIDVSDFSAMRRMRDEVARRLGPVSFLMNNAVTRIPSKTWENVDAWRHTFEVNFMGVINGVMAFSPSMIGSGRPGLIVNVGSKQGITNPPGNPAYNAAKAAVKHYTESLCHELRGWEGCAVTAHLLIPGWTTTGNREHKPGAWLPDQVVAHMMEALGRGDFYILCPDNEVTLEMDRKRVAWAAGDITENRPALSRWHPDFADAFRDFEGS